MPSSMPIKIIIVSRCERIASPPSAAAHSMRHCAA
jgi:hypothetical protein